MKIKKRIHLFLGIIALAGVIQCVAVEPAIAHDAACVLICHSQDDQSHCCFMCHLMHHKWVAPSVSFFDDLFVPQHPYPDQAMDVSITPPVTAIFRPPKFL
ncbi:MAG: hypothetical protein PHN49_10230 [Candidatus Omnitrophica bacterium]|nr:hypothetical protein [Candidatus Omnitrophota bacterium]MDD5672007.1 hypothetical protein [Candidatus Omnitrophota bacterium]